MKKLLEYLTNSYKDKDHTNAMLEWLERDFEKKPEFIGNVQASS